MLDEIVRPSIELALERSVASARRNLAGTPWALEPDAPFRLIALHRPEPDSVPMFAGFETTSEFLKAVEAWATTLLLGAYFDGPPNYVPPTAGIALRIIAALKARTVACTGEDLLHLIMKGLHQLDAGDTRSFGAVPTTWTDPWGEEHQMIIAGTGGHPVADRYAAQLFPQELDISTMINGLWRPRVVASSSFVLSRSPHQTRIV